MNEPVETALTPIVDVQDLEDALDQGKEALERDTDACLAHFPWDMVRARIAEAIGETLRSDGLLWLAHGWSAALELREFKDTDRYPRGKTAFLKLGKHTLTGTLHPKVALSCAGAEVASIPFDVPIEGDFNAVTLSIRDGAVTGFGGGECAISLQIKYRDAELSPKLPVKTIRLPGSYEFKQPIAIP